MGQVLQMPAVPPKLMKIHPLKLTHFMYALRSVTGAARQLLLTLRLSVALISPFTKNSVTAIPPPAALLKRLF